MMGTDAGNDQKPPPAIYEGWCDVCGASCDVAEVAEVSVNQASVFSAAMCASCLREKATSIEEWRAAQ